MAYSIITADLQKDRNTILDLWKKIPEMQNITEAKWDWLYSRNPQGEASVWLALRDSIPVGTLAVIPRRLLIHGRETTAGVASDFGVLKEHRAFGPAMTLQAAAATSVESGHFAFLFGIPNERSLPVLRKVGYVELGDGRWLTKPLRLETGDAGFSPKKLLNPLLHIASRENLVWNVGPDDLPEIEAFDARADELWSRMQKRFSVLVARSAEELNWRYAANKGQRTYERYGYFSTDKRQLLAYVCAYRTADRLHIADFGAATESDADAILAALIKRERRNHTVAISVVYFGASAGEKTFRRFGFLRRPTTARFVVRGPEKLVDEIRNPEDWYLFEGDTDT